MERVHLHNDISIQPEPIYLLLSKIRPGETIYLGNHEITLNQSDIYKISSAEADIEIKSLQKCYEYMNQLNDTNYSAKEG